VRALLDSHVHSESGGQGLFQSDAYTQTDDRGERAVGNGRGQINAGGRYAAGDGRARGGCGWLDGDVGEIDDSELTQGQRMFGVGNGRYEIWNWLSEMFTIGTALDRFGVP
jgi:hypothetical protein